MTNRDWRIIAAVLITLVDIWTIIAPVILPDPCKQHCDFPLWFHLAWGVPIMIFVAIAILGVPLIVWHWALKERP